MNPDEDSPSDAPVNSGAEGNLVIKALRQKQLGADPRVTWITYTVVSGWFFSLEKGGRLSGSVHFFL